jgi:hypothetical protein
MRRSSLPLLALFGLLGLALFAGQANAWYPMTTQAEVATATWCTWCTAAYTGLDAVKAKYDVTEFNAIRYYHSSGNYGCATSTTRINYYAAVGYPELYFDGTVGLHRITSEAPSGIAYQAIVNSQLDDPAYFKLTINSVDLTPPGGSIDLNIEVKEDVPNISNMKLRMIITEDGLIQGDDTLDDVTRGGIADIAITVNTNGQIQNVNQTFALDPSWNPANLAIIAFIQNDTDKQVMASASTDAPPPLRFRYYALGDKFEVGPLTNDYYFEWFRTYNTGSQPSMFTWTVTREGPADWMSLLCSQNLCYGPVFSQVLNPGQYIDLKIGQIVPSPGVGVAHLNITTDTFPDPEGRNLEFTYVTEDVRTLVVDDDGLQNYETYYTDALDYYGVDYAVMNTVYTEPTADLLSNFDVVIWETGLAYPTLAATDRAALSTYLNNGGNLFLAGQDVGWELFHIGGTPYQWMQTALHTLYMNDDTDDYTLDGVSGDPISDGIALTIHNDPSGDGANNQDSPSEIKPADDDYAKEIWYYTPTQAGAVRINTGTYKAVYFAFGFEAINNAFDRYRVMHRILNWLNGTTASIDEPVFREALTIYPNPIQRAATLRYTLPTAERATLSIFGADGRLVRTLASGALTAGTHVVEWDRTGGAGERLPAGLYYCRLTGERTNLTQKVVVLN